MRTYDIFTETTSTSTLPSIAVSIPSGLPMSGTVIDFTPYTHIASAVDRLSIDNVETMEDSPMDTFLYWWNLMWLIVFGLWLIREFYDA